MHFRRNNHPIQFERGDNWSDLTPTELLSERVSPEILNELELADFSTIDHEQSYFALRWTCYSDQQPDLLVYYGFDAERR